MVLVEVVEDREEAKLQPGENESDFETDSNPESDALSDVSDDDDDFSPADETLYERLSALKDIVPPQTRNRVVKTFGQGKAWTWWSLKSVGNVAWWVSTSALLVGLPLALAIEDETRVVQQEREMQMQTQGQQQLLGGQPGQQSGVLPPGF